MENITFKAEKDLGTILQDSAQFIKQNLLQILKVSLPVAAVPLLIGAVFISMFYYNLSSSMTAMSQGQTVDPNQIASIYSSFFAILPGYFFISIAMMLYYIANISYIKHYVNGDRDITVGTILADIKSKSLLLFFGGILTLIIVDLGMMLCLLPGIYLGVIFSLQFIIAIVEDKGYGYSFGRSFKLMKNNWWASFGLYFVTMLIIGAISFMVVLPFYIYMGVSAFTSVSSGSSENAMSSLWVMSLMMPLMLAVNLLCMTIMNTVASMNYYSLTETLDGNAEMDAINSIGK